MKTEDLERFQVMLEHMRAQTLESLGRVQQEGRSMGEASRGDMGECSVTNFSREFAFQQSTRKRHTDSRPLELKRIPSQDLDTNSQFVQVKQQIPGVLVDAISPGALQFVLPVAARQQADAQDRKSVV